MTLFQAAWALVCVAMISVGQLLFKRAGLALAETGTWFDVRVLATVGVAGVIYAAATLLWIGLLRTVALNRAYVFMALSFVIVPVAANLLFREPLSAGVLAGSALIALGILVSVYYA